MASRPGPQRLLGSLAKTTSAGILPALVVALLLCLAGCGGGGSSAAQQGSSAAAQSAPEGAAGGGAGASSGSRRAKASTPRKTSKDTTARDTTTAKAKPAGGVKQGPSIPKPHGKREPAPTAHQRSEAVLASMALLSPALSPGPESISVLPPAYTCDGKDTPPPLRWSGVPSGTRELVLFVLNLEPVNEALFFDWAVAGIDPGLGGLEPEQLPKGAILGRNSFGREAYSICPPKGSAETIIFALYALPEPLRPQRGFDPMALRQQVLGASHNSGLMAVTYGR